MVINEAKHFITEHDSDCLTSEASSLSWDTWPREFTLVRKDGTQKHFVHEQDLYQGHNEDKEFAGAIYKSKDGIIFEVFND